MSDICERFCPAYEACIRVLDASNDRRSSLLDQRNSIDNPSEMDDILGYADVADLSDEEIDRLRADRRAKVAAAEDQLDYRIGLTEDDLALAASALMECDSAQASCDGPTISLIGRLAMNLTALWHRKRPSQAEKERYLGYFARCSSDIAKAASRDLTDALS